MKSLPRGRRLRRALLPWLAAVIGLTPPALIAQEEGEWVAIFNGRDLEGWSVPDARYWTVEGEAIAGRITAELPCSTNQYLVWAGGELADFEIKLRSRLRGQGGINNGFQFRSRILPDFDVCGYQVDNNLETPWLVRLYDEHGRHTLAMRGERTHFDSRGQRMTSRVKEGHGDAWFRLEEWHEYHLTCVGPRITLRIDGRLAAEVVDEDPQRQDLQGIFALQLHSGPPTVVEFRDIHLRVIRPAVAPAPPATSEWSPQREALQRDALAWWAMDVGGHGATPWLKHFPEWDRIELNTAAVGPGARAGMRVCLVHGAHFETSSDLYPQGEALTVYLRLRDAEGRWDAELMNQGTSGGPFTFNLNAIGGTDSSASEIAFEVSTEGGRGRASFPASQIDRTAWTDLMGRYDGKTLTLFANGIPMNSIPLKGRLRPSSAPLLIAAARTATGEVIRHFHGALEIAALWPRALSDQEIRSLSDSPLR